MISMKMVEALNGQIAKEFYSAYLYLGMAGYFEEQALPGFAKWMRVQGQEESAHAMILFNYVCEQGGRINLGVIEAPPQDFTSPSQIFEKVLAHEQGVTASIHKLVDIAVEERDYATRQMLDWFVAEQVEEESGAATLVARLNRVKNDPASVELLDKELAARVFNVPPPLVGKI